MGERERERERDQKKKKKSPKLFYTVAINAPHATYLTTLFIALNLSFESYVATYAGKVFRGR